MDNLQEASSQRIGEQNINMQQENEENNQLNERAQPEGIKYIRNRRVFIISFLVFEIICLFLFGFYVKSNKNITQNENNIFSSLLVNSNIMAIVGFGFFMSSHKGYSWSAIAYILLIYIVSFQAYIIFQSLLWNPSFIENQINPQASIEQQYMIRGVYSAITMMIAFGAVYGKVGSCQIFWMCIVGVFGYTLCENILRELKPTFYDAGGSTFVHCFGACFGLSIARVIFHDSDPIKNVSQNYVTTKISFIGMLLMWICWPSFNAGFIFDGNNRQDTDNFNKKRALVYLHTQFALIGSCVSSFIFNVLFSRCKQKIQKINVYDIMNGSLTGGVIIGASSAILGAKMGVGLSLIIGFFGGFISILCHQFLKPRLQDKKIMYDSRRILYLHGIPGLLGGIISAIIAAVGHHFRDDKYIRENYFQPSFKQFPNLAGIQLGGTFLCFGIALLFGIIFGFILKGFRRCELLESMEEKDEYHGIQIDDKLEEKRSKALDRLKNHF